MDIQKQSTPITKEGLESLGFEWAYEYDNRNEYELYIKPNYCITVKIYDTTDTDIFITDVMQVVEVPNCNTIEDLQTLINLFK